MTEYRRQRISSGGPWEERVGYSRAVRVGDHVWVSGSTGVEADGAISDSVEHQARRAFEVIANALIEAGASLADVVVARIYLVDVADFDAIVPVVKEQLGDARPAMVAVQVAGLVDDRMRVEIEVEAVAHPSTGVPGQQS